jgi:hypothetical protein
MGLTGPTALVCALMMMAALMTPHTLALLILIMQEGIMLEGIMIMIMSSLALHWWTAV